MKKLHRMLITWTPPVPDSAWMLMVKIAVVPPVEIAEHQYVEVPAVYELDDAMGWSEYFPEDWPAPCLN